MEVEGPSLHSRRPWPEVGEALSRSRKRTCLRRPLLPPPPPQYDVDDESEEEEHESDDEDDENHDQDPEESDDNGEEEEEDHEERADNGEEEEEEEQEEQEEEEERGDSGSEQESSDQSDGDDDAVEDREEEEAQQQQEVDGGGDQPPPQPEVVEDATDSDDDRPIPLSRAAVRRGSTAPSPVLAPPSSSPTMSPPCSESSVIGDVTVENTGHVLDCGICFLPLKPPIFQCDVGHVVCSPCRDRLPAAGGCHVCRGRTSFRRCHAMEQLVDSIRVPCPHAAHGCATRPAYHDRERHARACEHAPCHCPGEACGFAAGSTAALVDHFAAAHGWPCTAEHNSGVGFGVMLRDGFNFVTIGGGAAAAEDQVAATTTTQYLFLLKVTRAPPFGRIITALCIHRRHPAIAAAAATATVKLTYTRYMPSDMCRLHKQSSEFKVACTDLSGGLPDPSECFQFVVPISVRGDDEAVTRVMMSITPPPVQ
ncbi:hypothetical protein ACP70R_041296 [Stipagrostis hirtigluma subsp. patula]